LMLFQAQTNDYGLKAAIKAIRTNLLKCFRLTSWQRPLERSGGEASTFFAKLLVGCMRRHADAMSSSFLFLLLFWCAPLSLHVSPLVV